MKSSMQKIHYFFFLKPAFNLLKNKNNQNINMDLKSCIYIYKKNCKVILCLFKVTPLCVGRIVSLKSCSFIPGPFILIFFIDYTKAFDRVRHDEIIKELSKLKIDGKDLRIIKNMYWEQTAAMRVEGEISAFQKIKRGVRQGCVLSPDLFSLYSETIMRNIEGQPGIRVGGHNINNLRYADDTVLISENEKDLQLLNIVESKSKEKRLELNSKKTEVMVISRKEEPPLINIMINGIKLKQRDYFKYLGALVSSDGRNNTEISARIAQAKMTFQKMKSPNKPSHINSHKKKNP